MKIGIMSMYYSNISHGGLLQAYSLCMALECMKGNEAEQITYDYNYRFRPKTLATKAKRLIRKLPNNTLSFILGDNTKELYNIFADEIPHSKYYSPETITQIGDEYDCIIVGSDQVWNMEYCDKAFYLPFSSSSKKISYAASAGKDELNPQELDELVKAIGTFDYVSVRENGLRKQLKMYSSKEIELVCDPVFLNERAFWEDIAVYPRIGTKYTLVYMLGRSGEEKNEAIALAKKMGNTVVTVPNVNLNMSLKDVCSRGKKAYGIGPREFLGLIHDADCVLTDSFHCVAFSLIFNKDFYAFSRKNQDFSMDARITSILQSVNLESRFIELSSCGDIENKVIDYEHPNKLMREMVDSSREWLKKSLGQ